MGVTFTTDGPIGFITLDKPPANSYDLAFMTEFSEAVDEAVVGATRVVIVQSASEKFFSAGADIKKFLEGDVSANMEMIKVSQSAFRRMAAAPQVFIASHRGSRARRRPRDRARLRHPPRRRGSVQAGPARGDARAAPGQRRHPAAHPTDRAVQSARAAAHRAHLHGRGGARDGARGGRVQHRRSAESRSASTRSGSPAAPASRSPRSSGACTRAANSRSPTGLRSRPS